MRKDEQHTSPLSGQKRPIAAAIHAQAPVQESISSPLETAIKLAGLAGVVSATMGLPAVFLQFKRLGIPTYYIDYQRILSAGILPTILLAAIALYFRSVLRQNYGSDESVTLHQAVLIPLILPGLPFLLIGAVAFVLLYLWGISWMLMLPFHWWGLFDLTNRQLLYAATLLGVLGSIVYFLRERLLKLKPVQWLLTLLPIRILVDINRAAFHKSSGQVGQPLPEARTKQKRTPEQQAMKWLPLLPIMWLIIPAMYIGQLFSIKGVLYLWEPQLTKILPAETILWVGVGLGFMYGLVMSSVAWMEFLECENRRMKNIGMTIALVSLLLAGGFFVTLYSTKIYSILSQAWGGGRPELVMVWISKENLPSIEEMRRRLPKVNMKQEGSVMMIGATLVLRAGKEMILLNRSGGIAQGVAIPTESLKMVAWGPK